MRMRFLGKSGIKVSELCLGTMTFGTNTRNKRSVNLPKGSRHYCRHGIRWRYKLF